MHTCAEFFPIVSSLLGIASACVVAGIHASMASVAL